MDDTGIVRHNPEGVRDAVLNPDTGQLVEPAPERTTIHAGRMKVKHRGEGAEQSQYEVSWPISSGAPSEGDYIKVTTARRDLKLVGLELTVFEIVRGTFQVQHKVYARVINSG